MKITTPVFLDKQSIMIDIPIHEQAYTYDSIVAFCDRESLWIDCEGEDSIRISVERIYSGRLLHHFRRAYCIQTTRGPVTVQLVPKFPDMAFSRFEWNPSRLKTLGPEVVVSLLRFTAPYYVDRWLSASITKVDATIDVRPAYPAEFLIFSNHARMESNRDLKYGPLTLQAVGAERGDVRLCSYDKTHQLKRDGLMSKLRRVPNCTRFETRLRRLGPWLAAATSVNPFAGLNICDLARARSAARTKRLRRFVADCERRGAQVALREQSPNARTRLRQFLKESAAVEWFDPEARWLELQEAIWVSCSPNPH